MLYKGEIPFVRFLIPLMFGITTAYFYGFNCLDLVLALLFCALGVFTILMIAYRHFSLYRDKWFLGFLLHLIIFTGAYWLTVKQSEKFDKQHYSRNKSDALMVKVANEPKLSKGILRLESEVIETVSDNRFKPASGKLMLAVKVDSTRVIDLKYGDVLLIPAMFDPIEPPYNPGEFDYGQYLANRQIYFQSFIQSADIHKLSKNAGNPVIFFALNLRKRLVEKFANYIPDKDAAAFASTLILGYRAELSPELISAYSKTGTMHVLSVSGMHVGIVFLVLSFLLKFMDKNQMLRLIRAFLVISIIWFYALITGFSAPACRAAVMLSFVVLGKAINKNQNTYNLIAISAFFLLLYNPYNLMDAGFQLSYLAVAGLVYFHPKIYHTIYLKNKILDYSWSYCALSIGAQLATFPISVYYFHQFPVYFLFSNLFIVLPVALIMYAGIVFMFLPASFILIYLGRFLNWLIIFTNDILYYIENMPFSSWGGIWISSFQYILLYLILLCFVLRVSFKYRSVLMPSALILVLSVSIVFDNYADRKRHEIVFYNLRRNTAIAYLNQGKGIVVSDIGKDDKLANFSIHPALNSKGSDDSTFYIIGESHSSKGYFLDRNFYQFADYRIIRWDKSFDGKTFTGTLKVNAVFISGNPRVKIAEISSVIDLETLIIDANNPDYKIENWKTEAREMNISCQVLKKNPAYIIKL